MLIASSLVFLIGCGLWLRKRNRIRATHRIRATSDPVHIWSGVIQSERWNTPLQVSITVWVSYSGLIVFEISSPNSERVAAIPTFPRD